MTAEWLHLPPPYPPGAGLLCGEESYPPGAGLLCGEESYPPGAGLLCGAESYPPGVELLCGAELEAWYEDLQDILRSDGGGAKLARAPPCSEKEPEFLDVLESCSLTWLTDGVGVGGAEWGGGEGVQSATISGEPPTHPPQNTSSNSSCLSPADERAERPGDRERGRDGERGVSGGGDLLPPEFFELLSEGGVGMVETGGCGSYHHHQLHHHSNNVQQPESPSTSEEEHPCVPDSPSCSSSASPPSSPLPSPTSTAFSLSRPGKRKRGNSLSFPSSSSHSSSSSTKKSRREREQENERKVQVLTDQNERLKAEIDRLGEEVQRTRRALIERLVNTRK